jgi:HMG (high mobility group) box
MHNRQRAFHNEMSACTHTLCIGKCRYRKCDLLTETKPPKKRKTPNPFLFYCHEIIPKLRLENPEWSFGALSQEASRSWKHLSEEEHQVYIDKSAAATTRINDAAKAPTISRSTRCLQCSEKHRPCSGGVPCDGCLRLDIECTEKPPRKKK